MALVHNTLIQPNGDPVNARSVTIKLASAGWLDGELSEILSYAVALIDRETGYYEVELPANADIDPAGTHYVVREPHGDTLEFVVPGGAGPFWLRDILVENPDPPDPVYAGVTPAELAAALAGIDQVPDGGTAGQALVKISGADGDADWRDVAGGTGLDLDPLQFPSTRAGTAAVLAGTRDSMWVVAGDSIPDGYLTSRAQSWPTRLIELLGSSDVPFAEGPVPVPDAFSTDSRWAAGAGWAVNYTLLGVIPCYVGSAGAGNLTFTAPAACDKFDIYYITNSIAGSFSGSVDGGSATVVNTATATGAAKATISAASLAAGHVLTLNNIPTSLVVIWAIHARDSTSKRVYVCNLSVAGTRAQQWALANDPFAPSYTQWLLDSLDPDLTIAPLGINDAATRTAGQFQTDLTAMAAYRKAQGSDVLIVGPVPPQGPDAPLPAVQAFVDAKAWQNAATATNSGFYDLYRLWVSYVVGSALGYYADSVHLTALGQWSYAASLSRSLRALVPAVVPAYSTAALLSAAMSPDAMFIGTITRDGSGVATSAAVLWPDGTRGTYTADTVSASWPAVDAYHVTYGIPLIRTYTQTAVTRDAITGQVTVRPAVAVA